MTLNDKLIIAILSCSAIAILIWFAYVVLLFKFKKHRFKISQTILPLIFIDLTFLFGLGFDYLLAKGSSTGGITLLNRYFGGFSYDTIVMNTLKTLYVILIVLIILYMAAKIYDLIVKRKNYNDASK